MSSNPSMPPALPGSKEVYGYRTALILIEKLNNALKMVAEFNALKIQYDDLKTKPNSSDIEQIKLKALRCCKIDSPDSSSSINLHLDQPIITIRAVNNRLVDVRDKYVRTAAEMVKVWPRLAFIRVSIPSAQPPAPAPSPPPPVTRTKIPKTPKVAKVAKVAKEQKSLPSKDTTTTTTTTHDTIDTPSMIMPTPLTAAQLAQRKINQDARIARENEARRCIVELLKKNSVAPIDFLMRPEHPLRIDVHNEAERVFAQTGGNLLRAAVYADYVIEDETKKMIRNDLSVILSSNPAFVPPTSAGTDIKHGPIIDDRCVEFLYEARRQLIGNAMYSVNKIKRKSCEVMDTVDSDQSSLLKVWDQIETKGRWALTDLARLGHERCAVLG